MKQEKGEIKGGGKRDRVGGKSWLLDELCNDLPTSTENNYWCYFYFKTMFRTWFLSLETFFFSSEVVFLRFSLLPDRAVSINQSQSPLTHPIPLRTGGRSVQGSLPPLSPICTLNIQRLITRYNNRTGTAQLFPHHRPSPPLAHDKESPRTDYSALYQYIGI